MAGAIAHHFNNHLTAVMGNLELAIDDLPPARRLWGNWPTRCTRLVKQRG